MLYYQALSSWMHDWLVSKEGNIETNFREEKIHVRNIAYISTSFIHETQQS